MELVPPFWFKQRQGKAEPIGDNTFRLTAPQESEAFISIRQGPDGRWFAAVRAQQDGPDLAVTEPVLRSFHEARDAAFELYRRTFII